MAPRCNGMWNSRRHDADLAAGDAHKLVVEPQAHLTFEDQQRFIETVLFAGILSPVHPQNFEVDTGRLADDGGAPGAW